MINPIILPELRSMLAEGDHEGLACVMNELHPATVAEFSEGLSASETWQLLDHGSIERPAAIFVYFPLAKQAEMVHGVGPERMSKLLEAMAPDSRTELLRRLPYLKIWSSRAVWLACLFVPRSNHSSAVQFVACDE